MVEQYISIEKKVEMPEIRETNRRPPVKPVSLGIRLEGQLENESYEEAEKRIKKQNKRMGALFLGLGVMGITMVVISFIEAFLDRM